MNKLPKYTFMKLKKILLTLLCTVTFAGAIYAFGPETQLVTDKQTMTFAIKGTDTLRLDKYDCPQIIGNKPCIIFMFGGGFKDGSRKNEEVVSYMNRLTEKGYVAIAIDYRLGLKNLRPEQTQNISLFAGALFNAVNMAVEDRSTASKFGVTILAWLLHNFL